MPLPPRIFPGDEELGKRDDDHKYTKPNPLSGVLTHTRLPQKRNIKRLGILFVALIGLYYFFKNMPTDIGPASRRPNYQHGPGESPPNWVGRSQPNTGSPGSPPIQKGIEEVKEKHSFNGPIKFYKLASSLHAISRNGGGSWANQNVLFAASSLKSASALLPMACEMAILKRNNVHFALLGRDDISIDTLKEVNGVDKGCDIYYHDARPDFSVISSDYRMEVSCGAALNHINNFMHPQAVIIDGSDMEDPFFATAFRSKSVALEKTLIELPKNAEQNLMWITRLDSSSLSAWNKVSIDIVIHAQPAASGSLLRLLTSLSKADYFSSTPPALTIELPQKIEGPTRQFLETYQWPPSRGKIEGNDKRLILRHRIPQYGLTAEENSIRFLESFWPATPGNSHILVLAPHVELSPLYFHYLKYTLLEYKYGAMSSDERSLMGISLDLPSTYLNDTTNFLPPFLKDRHDNDIEETAPFLWQAPNSNAALYFGDHWTEFHSFISQSLAASHTQPTATTLNKKLVSKTYPSWLEHILTLSRARGYWLLYPNLANQTALATVHNELYQRPEEFGSKKEDNEYAGTDEDWTIDPAHLSLQHEEMPLARTTLLNMLPSDAVLASIGAIPHISWDGQEMPGFYEMQLSADAYAEVFRRESGGCGISGVPQAKVAESADDLFCLDTKSFPLKEDSKAMEGYKQETAAVSDKQLLIEEEPTTKTKEDVLKKPVLGESTTPPESEASNEPEEASKLALEGDAYKKSAQIVEDAAIAAPKEVTPPKVNQVVEEVKIATVEDIVPKKSLGEVPVTDLEHNTPKKLSQVIQDDFEVHTNADVDTNVVGEKEQEKKVDREV